MPHTHSHDTDELLRLAHQGDVRARDLLWRRYRRRLRRLFAVRMDSRLAVRVDPSDAVQDTFFLAAQRLPDYLDRRPLPFYPWLRQLAMERLIQLHRQHVLAGKRSVRREAPRAPSLPDESINMLAERLVVCDSAPDRALHREEQGLRVRQAINRLPARDREILVLRYLEQLSTKQIGAVLGLSVAAVKLRHFRAVRKLRERLETGSREGD
ncbi:MAG: sigma-70 family RNA polymerase sigma factor [Planctomycetaceae bacterium]